MTDETHGTHRVGLSDQGFFLIMQQEVNSINLVRIVTEVPLCPNVLDSQAEHNKRFSIFNGTNHIFRYRGEVVVETM